MYVIIKGVHWSLRMFQTISRLKSVSDRFETVFRMKTVSVAPSSFYHLGYPLLH